MTTRVLAYALEYREGIAMTEGVSSGDEPAVLVRDLTGRITAWIEVGMPDASRLHRASKLADRVAVYTHRDVATAARAIRGAKIHRAADIPIYAFDGTFIDDRQAAIERRTSLSMSVADREIYAALDDRTFQGAIVEHRIKADKTSVK